MINLFISKGFIKDSSKAQELVKLSRSRKIREDKEVEMKKLIRTDFKVRVNSKIFSSSI